MIRGVPYDHQLEYIESTGSQYIDTGIKPSLDLVAKIKLCNLAATGDVIFGFTPSPWGTAGDTKDWRMFNAGSTLYFDILAGKRINGTSFVSGVWREFELGNYYVKDLSTGQVLISGTAATDSTPYNSNTFTITLNRAQGQGTMSRNRWSYVKIYRGETLIQDLIPVSVNGVAKMYDRVTGAFPKHYGTFVAGPVASTPLMGVHMYQAANLWKQPTEATWQSASPSTIWSPIPGVVYTSLANNGYSNSRFYDPFADGPDAILSTYSGGYCATVFLGMPPGNYVFKAETDISSSFRLLHYVPAETGWRFSYGVNWGVKSAGKITYAITIPNNEMVAIYFRAQNESTIKITNISITEATSS